MGTSKANRWFSSHSFFLIHRCTMVSQTNLGSCWKYGFSGITSSLWNETLCGWSLVISNTDHWILWHWKLLIASEVFIWDLGCWGLFRTDCIWMNCWQTYVTECYNPFLLCHLKISKENYVVILPAKNITYNHKTLF